MNAASSPFSSHEPPPSGLRSGQRSGTPWLRVLRWFQENTFAPGWLPEPLRHPLIGYLVAGIIEGLAASLLLLLLFLFPTFDFQGILTLVGVALVALGWGAGPSLFASLVGTFLLCYLVLPPNFSWMLADPADAIGLVLFLALGVGISLLAGQNERRRRQAEEMARLLTQMEARSRVDAEHLRTVLEVLPSAVLITNRAGQIQAMNQATRTLWGGDIPLGADIMQSPRLKVWWSQSGQPLAPDEWTLDRALASGQAVLNDELEIGTLDRRRNAILCSAAPIRDATGAMTGAVISAQDISELRRLEREVAERAQELEAIFETITDGVALLDGQGQLVRTNQAFRRLLGFDQHPEYLALPYEQRQAAFTIRTGEGRPLILDALQNSAPLQGKTFTGVDLIIDNLDGREVVVNVDGVSLHDHLGKVTGYIEVYRDVTARHHLEQRTRETLGALVAMAEAIVQIRPTTSMVDVVGDTGMAPLSDATLPMVARRLGELTRTVLECRRVSIVAVDPATGQLSPVTEVGLPAEQEEAWWASWSPAQGLEERYGGVIAAAMQAGEPALLDTLHLPERSRSTLFGARSGQIVPMRLGEELVGVLVVDYLEPDHNASAEERLFTVTLARLGALVLERDRLVRGWAEARANELALGETTAQMDTFLGIASHELKTPLTSLKLSLYVTERRLRKLTMGETGGEIVDETVDETGEPPAESAGRDAQLSAVLERLSHTDRQVERMERLANDLLDVSRIRAGKLELRPEKVDLVAIVREVVEAQWDAEPERLIQFQLAADQSALVYADRGRIEQVVTNYVTNALKYSSVDRPVDVGVEVGPERVRVWVRDQGPGLPVEEQERIWERFHRAQGVEVQSGSEVGLGLGLYISRMIVERHHGQFGVESTPGVGSKFWFSLPLAESAPASADS